MKTTTKDIRELQERLVQTCIDFINEKGVDDIWGVEFNADDLQSSAKVGKWVPFTDSYLCLEGITDGDKDNLPKRYTIGESF